MLETNDMELVRQFARDNSETAFTTLVQRHLNLVYSVARRCTGNDNDARDVTQAVFILLARKASGLHEKTLLAGWLYETTRFTAARLLRTNARRHAREQEAFMQSTLTETGATDAWTQLAPHLEDAMSALGESDRALLVLRFYENKTGAEAAALLGIGEDAVRKRASRAIEKLRKFFAKRGVAISGSAIAGAVSANSIQAAPAGLEKMISAAALSKGATASLSSLALIKGATAKGIMSFASLGGLLALFGSAYVSLKAQADDSKSPRERQFMVRMFWKRATVYLLWAAGYFIAQRLGFFHSPICFDFFAAAFVFYLFCVDLLILAREQNLRRRQIQIEEHTYNEAEWTLPRKVTDPTTGSVNVKNMLTALKFCIFWTILVMTIWFQFGGAHALYEGWKVRSKHPAAEVCLIISLSLMAASFAASPYTSLCGWQKRPRFVPIRGDGPPPRSLLFFPIIFPIKIGLITLLVFDVHECLIGDGSHDSEMVSLNGVIAFNAVVFLVYTVFTIRTIGILAKRRKNFQK
jgi:RNA polymerase sigma factor (sigma-70 family)